MIRQAVDFFLHLDAHLGAMIRQYGAWSYVFLFLIIFGETGLVVASFLPGDSLLFAAGTFAASGALSLKGLLVLLGAAAVAGNMTNYQIGLLAGPKVFHSERLRLLNRRHLEETHRFYEKWGAMTIVLANFVPIIRTFASFLAGVGRMTRWRFSLFTAAGSLAWIFLVTLAGYLFGNIPAVRKNFTLVVAAIIVISVLPAAAGYIKSRAKRP